VWFRGGYPGREVNQEFLLNILYLTFISRERGFSLV
jgi:hypothetical protein